MTKHFKSSDPPVTQTNSSPDQPPQAAESLAPLGPEPEAVLPVPVQPEVAAPEVTEPAQPEPLTEPEPAAPRRSSRASKPVDKLQVSWGTKSYAQAVSGQVPSSLGIRDSLACCEPRGGGGRH